MSSSIKNTAILFYRAWLTFQDLFSYKTKCFTGSSFFFFFKNWNKLKIIIQWYLSGYLTKNLIYIYVIIWIKSWVTKTYYVYVTKLWSFIAINVKILYRNALWYFFFIILPKLLNTTSRARSSKVHEWHYSSRQSKHKFCIDHTWS